ncbi:MAG: UDP-N-acetylglucosamine--N-acetylmuramyl-(pentapeptide) pyrophosphoryl-undecaprenol N-acetylglucosamine transferase [Patescibacteria group bacterium]
MKILITGGHITPALAVIDYVKKNHPDDEIVFLGRTYSQDSNRQLAIEKSEINKRGLKFIPYSALRVVNAGILLSWPKLAGFLSSLKRAKSVINQEKPDIFLSFGGYLAVPVALAAWLSRVPIVTHEQTKAAGMANRLISFFASKVAISFDSSRRFFNSKKTVMTGNPMRAALFNDKNRPDGCVETSRPLLLVLGGNQGSKVINQTVAQSLPTLLDHWHVVHQCGKPTLTDNYQQQLQAAAADLDKEKQDNYVVKEWIEELELAWLYDHATAVLSRAGANTVMEIAAFGVPAILVPLPNSYNQEQLKNAQWLAEAGCAEILPQDELSPSALGRLLRKIESNQQQMKLAFHKLDLEFDADKKIYQLLAEQLQK